jgi:hypothetical protein
VADGRGVGVRDNSLPLYSQGRLRPQALVQEALHVSPSAKAGKEVKEVKPRTAVATRVVERRIDLSIGFWLNYDLANYITSELSLIYSRAAPECHQSKNSKSLFVGALMVNTNG